MTMFEVLSDVSALFTLFLVVFVTLLWFNISRRPRSMPPGPPIRVPILGNLYDIDPDRTLEMLKEYRAKYGDIFSLKMGTKWILVANGYDVIKDILVKNADNFSGRPDLFTIVEINQKMGLIGSSGALWKEHRTFALATLRQFGFGKRSLEGDIMAEVQVCLRTLAETCGQPYDMTKLIQTCISDVTCALVFGKRYEHTDPKFIRLLNSFDENLKIATFAGLINFIPFLKLLPGDLFSIKKLIRNVDIVEEFLYGNIEEHMETYDENNIRDYIDAFIKEMRRHGKETGHTFTEKQLLKSVADLFIAGTETTATTIRWTILYLLHYPEVQKRMLHEIEEVVGESRFPSMTDRSKMPYFEAVITEALRCGNIVPLSIPHNVDRDVYYKGYTIPKDAVLLVNLDSVLTDPEVFPEPEKFSPSRFIDEDGKLVGQEKVLSFSTGRRVCLGESLARMELFLFLSTLVQRFQFLPEEEKPVPPLDFELGFTRSPKPYKFRAVLRS